MTLSMVVEHLSMVVFAIVIAILIGVPLGLLCYLSRAARGVVLRVVDLIQTTPALALLGIIMVTPLGAGKPTVILGLALYSLLPIVRNVTLGLSQVSPAVKEAAKGMGMTRVYSLFHVELPLGHAHAVHRPAHRRGQRHRHGGIRLLGGRRRPGQPHQYRASAATTWP